MAGGAVVAAERPVMSVMSVQQPGKQSRRKVQQANQHTENPLLHVMGAKCRLFRQMSSAAALDYELKTSVVDTSAVSYRLSANSGREADGNLKLEIGDLRGRAAGKALAEHEVARTSLPEPGCLIQATQKNQDSLS
jgi:glycerol-3-phosphate dehydrogenase